MTDYTMRQLLWDFVTLNMGVVPWLLTAMFVFVFMGACLSAVLFLQGKLPP